jgi:hypothetical protein
LETVRFAEIKTENEKIREANEELKERYDEIDESLQSTSAELYELQESSKHVYLNLISILGIFAAIVVAIFGSLQVINSISNAFLKGQFNLYNIILVSSMISLFICWTLSLLLSLARWKSGDLKITAMSLGIFLVINAICLTGISYSLHNLS